MLKQKVQRMIIDAKLEERWLRAASLCEEHRVTARFGKPSRRLE